MTLQEATDALHAIMYNDPWVDIRSITFNWARAGNIEDEGSHWIPIVRTSDVKEYEQVLVGPIASGRLIHFVKRSDVWKQVTLGSAITECRANWNLFCWNVNASPETVSSVFRENLWKMPPGMWKAFI